MAQLWLFFDDINPSLLHNCCLFRLLIYDKSNRSFAVKVYHNIGIYTRVAVLLLFCGV